MSLTVRYDCDRCAESFVTLLPPKWTLALPFGWRRIQWERYITIMDKTTLEQDAVLCPKCKEELDELIRKFMEKKP